MKIFIAYHCKTSTNVNFHHICKNREWIFVLKTSFTLVILKCMNKSNTEAIQIYKLSKILQKYHYI